MSVQSQRGRKVVRSKRNSLLYFWVGIGAVLLIAAAFLITLAVRSRGSTEVSTINAPVGQTADGFWYQGNPEAPVKVIEYADYQCPGCQIYSTRLGKIVERDYIETGKVQFIYHELPLTDIHANAVAAAEAARCAGDQGKYWEMHDMLFINQEQWANLRTPNNTYASYASQLGLSRTDFETCLSSGTHQQTINASMQSAVAAGVQATPTFNVNGQLVDANNVVAAIESALRAAGQ